MTQVPQNMFDMHPPGRTKKRYSTLIDLVNDCEKGIVDGFSIVVVNPDTNQVENPVAHITVQDKDVLYIRTPVPDSPIRFNMTTGKLHSLNEHYDKIVAQYIEDCCAESNTPTFGFIGYGKAIDHLRKMTDTIGNFYLEEFLTQLPIWLQKVNNKSITKFAVFLIEIPTETPKCVIEVVARDDAEVEICRMRPVGLLFEPKKASSFIGNSNSQWTKDYLNYLGMSLFGNMIFKYAEACVDDFDESSTDHRPFSFVELTKS